MQTIAAASGPPPRVAPKDSEPFRVVITPHRALSLAQYLSLVGLTLTLMLSVQVPLARAGAWPCLLFGLGEAGLLLAAVWLHRRDQDRVEMITVASGGLHVVRSRRGRVVDARRYPVFGLHAVRVDDPEYGCQALLVEARGRRTELARDLSPDERSSFAEALAAALGAAGGSPHLRIETQRSLLQHLSPGAVR